MIFEENISDFLELNIFPKKFTKNKCLMEENRFQSWYCKIWKSVKFGLVSKLAYNRLKMLSLINHFFKPFYYLRPGI